MMRGLPRRFTPFRNDASKEHRASQHRLHLDIIIHWPHYRMQDAAYRVPYADTRRQMPRLSKAGNEDTTA